MNCKKLPVRATHTRETITFKKVDSSSGAKRARGLGVMCANRDDGVN